MKKFLFAAAALLMAAFVVSCDNPFSFNYDVTIIGDADGSVVVTFPDGEFNTEGTVGIGFHYGKPVADHPVGFTLEQALYSNDPQIKKVAEAVNEDIAEQFTATALEGTYCLHIQGYVKENATGIVIEIDKTLTNR